MDDALNSKILEILLESVTVNYGQILDRVKTGIDRKELFDNFLNFNDVALCRLADHNDLTAYEIKALLSKHDPTITSHILKNYQQLQKHNLINDEVLSEIFSSIEQISPLKIIYLYQVGDLYNLICNSLFCNFNFSSSQLQTIYQVIINHNLFQHGEPRQIHKLKYAFFSQKTLPVDIISNYLQDRFALTGLVQHIELSASSIAELVKCQFFKANNQVDYATLTSIVENLWRQKNITAEHKSKFILNNLELSQYKLDNDTITILLHKINSQNKPIRSQSLNVITRVTSLAASYSELNDTNFKKVIYLLNQFQDLGDGFNQFSKKTISKILFETFAGEKILKKHNLSFLKLNNNEELRKKFLEKILSQNNITITDELFK